MTSNITKLRLKKEEEQDFPISRINLFEYKKQYWKYGKAKEGQDPPKVIVSNFVMECKGFIESELNEPKRLVRLVSIGKTTSFMAIDTKCFNGVSSFTELIESKGNFFFGGTKDDLLNLKKLVFSDGSEYTEAEALGYYPKQDFFVFSNGVLEGEAFCEPDKLGLAKGMYIPASAQSNLFNPDYHIQRKFEFRTGSDFTCFRLWAEAMAKVHGGEAMLVCSAFLLASLNFDVIAHERKFFPLLCLAGQKGSGKGTLARGLLSLFSREPDQTMVNNTTATAFMRKLEQYSNVPVWFDEFKNSLQAHKIEALKNIYDLIGKTVGVKSNDARTKQTRVTSPAIITGQEFPSDEALLSRCAILNLKVKGNPTSEEKYDFNRLETECAKGLGHVLVELMGYRETIKKQCSEAYYEARKRLSKLIETRSIKVNSRLLDIYGVLASTILTAFREGLPMDFLGDFSNETQEQIMFQAFADFVQEQSELEAQADEVMVFWQMFESMADKGVIKKGMDYKADYDKRECYIRNSVFDSYMKYYRDIHAEKSVDKKSLMKYLEQKPYYIRHSERMYFGGLEGEETKRSRCWVFDVIRLEEEGVIFE